MTETQKLTAAEIAERIPADFRQIQIWLFARYKVKDFATALALTDKVGEAAEAMNHHPDLDLRWGRLDVRLTTHATGSITENDLTLAARISELAAEVGATADVSGLQMVDIGLDTWDRAAVLPFWKAILGYDSKAPDEVVDPAGEGPTLWFQDTDEHETPRQRHHLDIWVPADQAEARVEAAVAAGGTLVEDQWAPEFWVLADQQGNRACICTVTGRDGQQ